MGEIMYIHWNWHQRHELDSTFGQRLADKVATGMGSWKFIIIQSAIIAVWIAVNIIAVAFQWDPYPFILLNLLFSTQAAYSAPIIMMSQNRAAARDRAQADFDHVVIGKIWAKLEKIDDQTDD